MKTTAAILQAPMKYSFVEEELPACGENDVLIKMVSLGICHSDAPVFAGVSIVKPNGKYGFREPSRPVYPLRLGHEAVAQVIEKGRNVKKFEVGDYVTGRMRYSQSTIMHVPDADTPSPTIQMYKIPKTNRDILCCLGEPMECVINMVRETRPQYGDHIAVIGCGFMGLLAIAGLKNSGCKKITAIDIDPTRSALALELGATEFLCSPEIDNLSEWAYEATEGSFFDTVIEVSGSIGGLNTALEIIKYTHVNGNAVTPYLGHGQIISSSVYSREEIVPASLGFNLMVKGPIIHNVHPSYGLNNIRNAELGIEAFVNGVFPMEKLVTHRTDFKDIGSAMMNLLEPPENYIKGIVTFDQ